ncbi:MAG: hypothetical protein GXO76_12190 [Calditrichaeota bacterium]|nr:hypothetical protein [Calditrichota bacterium]
MHWKGILLLLGVWAVVPAARASFTSQPIGARPVGMGLAFVAASGDPNAIVYNSAGMAWGKGLQATTFYSRPFGLKELETTFAALSFSGKKWTFGASFQQFGYSAYREQTTRIAIARQFGKRFIFGGSLFYARLKIAGYGEDGCLGVNFGYLFKWSSHWQFGASIRNATHSALKRGHEPLPQVLDAGLEYRPFSTFRFAFQISQETGFPPCFRSGIEWTLAKQLILRSGYLTEPGRFTLGCGFYWGPFRLDYAWASHLLLGGTHHVSVGIQF